MQEAEFIVETEESKEAVDIGRNIRNIRLRCCMSQEVFAERIGVSRQTVCNWERGYSLPAADKVGKIIKECSTTIEEILGTSVEKDKNRERLACEDEKVCAKPEKKNKVSLSKVFLITLLSAAALFVLFISGVVISITISHLTSDAFAISSAVSLGTADKLILAFAGCVFVFICAVVGIVKLIKFRRVKK